MSFSSMGSLLTRIYALSQSGVPTSPDDIPYATQKE